MYCVKCGNITLENNVYLVKGKFPSKTCKSCYTSNLKTNSHLNKLSVEERRKGDEVRKGQRRSIESRKKMSKAAKNKPPMSEYTKSLISKASSNRVWTKESREKISKLKKGFRHSEETKRILSEYFKNKKRSQESIEKTASKLRGRKRPKEVGKKISKSLVGKKLTKEHKLKISKSHIGISIPKSEETKRKMRISTLKYLKEFKEFKTPRIGKNEILFIDIIESILKRSLKRQYKCIGYFIDAYDEDNKIAYEIDELKHNIESNKLKDMKRQKNIEKELGCKFVRINDTYTYKIKKKDDKLVNFINDELLRYNKNE